VSLHRVDHLLEAPGVYFAEETLLLQIVAERGAKKEEGHEDGPVARLQKEFGKQGPDKILFGSAQWFFLVALIGVLLLVLLVVDAPVRRRLIRRSGSR